MAWGQKNLQASNVGPGPFVADYNRSYDTHTEHNSNTAFAVNPPDIADVGPYEYSGLGTDAQTHGYRNPSNRAPDQGAHGSPYGYLGDTIGPREIQTGNAPSGGYATRFSTVVGFQAGALPDNRRMAARNRRDDWEDNQAQIHENRDAELRYRRSLNVDENFVEFDHNPTAGEFASPQVNAITDSPYRKDWSDKHGGPDGAPGSATYKTNPNRFRNYDVFDRDADYRSRTRYLNGKHYSMAEHNSLNPTIMQTTGGNSVTQYKRNTYYMTPQAWDTPNTDGPSNTQGYATTISTVGGAQYGTSYRI